MGQEAEWGVGAGGASVCMLGSGCPLPAISTVTTSPVWHQSTAPEGQGRDIRGSTRGTEHQETAPQGTKHQEMSTLGTEHQETAPEGTQHQETAPHGTEHQEMST